MKSKNALYAPALLCVIYMLTGFSDRLIALLGDLSDSVLLSAAIIQCLVFLLPVAFYCRVRNINFLTALNLKPIPPSILGFAVLSFLLYFTGGAILKYAAQAFWLVPETAAPALTDLYPGQTALLVVSYVILPAVLEELVFRSILIHEYRPYGGVLAIGVSALSFAMLHFSFQGFPEAFLAGLVFAAVTYVCQSVLPAVLLHLANNALNVFLPDVFSQYVARTGNSVMLFYLLVAAFLLFMYLWLGQLEYIYSKKAADLSRDRRAQLLLLESERSVQEQLKPPSFWQRAKEVCLSPGWLVAVALFFLKATGAL